MLKAFALPKLKKAFAFLNKHREFILLLIIFVRLEQLHIKFDHFISNLQTFLFILYEKFDNALRYTQSVLLYFLDILGVES